MNLRLPKERLVTLDDNFDPSNLRKGDGVSANIINLEKKTDLAVYATAGVKIELLEPRGFSLISYIVPKTSLSITRNGDSTDFHLTFTSRDATVMPYNPQDRGYTSRRKVFE